MNWTFQLYSARKSELARSLAIVSEAGYKSVEAYSDNFNDSDEFKRQLDKHELRVPSMHINIGPLREGADKCMKRAREFGSSHIVCPYLDPSERPTDAVGWAVLIAELSDHAKRWQDAGFTFAWHNHDFEFEALADGVIPMQLILDNAPQLQWEIDVAWIVWAGADPLPWIDDHAARISAVHQKDLVDGNAAGDVWLGIRPEHIVTGEATSNAAFQMTVEVDIVEPTGADTLVLASIAGTPFRVRMDGQARVRPGETLAIGINPAAASVFEKVSEQRL